MRIERKRACHSLWKNVAERGGRGEKGVFKHGISNPFFNAWSLTNRIGCTVEKGQRQVFCTTSRDLECEATEERAD
jgi:hypothetical protein